MPVWVKGLIVVGGIGATAEAYNEIIALARGENPKTLLTGKYSITELVRSMNKKKKPDEQQQDKRKKIHESGYKPEEGNKKTASKKSYEKGPHFDENTQSKKSYEKGPYFDENTQKFLGQFSGKPQPVNSFKEFQRQVLKLGVDGILANNVIKNGVGPKAKDVSTEDETLRQVLASACAVISGQVSMNMSQEYSCNPYFVRVESESGNFYIYSGINNCGFELHDASDRNRFSFSNITGN